MIEVHEHDVVILGGGLAGLAAGSVLGPRAVVIERDLRPGGLVKSECFDGWWFDRVLHLLYPQNATVEGRLHELVPVLAPCPPDAWVHTPDGIVRYPFQMHLHGLPTELVARCLKDLAAATFGARREATNFEEMLLATFGEGLCDAFLFPYNQKMWKRPLSELAPSGFQWTITHPNFEQVVKGALEPDSAFASYNHNGWYPRPPADAPLRGMEVLSSALAARVSNLYLGHEVTGIDLGRREVTVRSDEGTRVLRWRRACLSTLPMPLTVSLTADVPAEIAADCRRLRRNRVRSVALLIRGLRPDLGCWRYFSDPSLVFNRLIFMHGFDPLTAPPEGWGLLAEITERGEDPPTPEAVLLARVHEDVERTGLLPEGSEIFACHRMEADPAYVVFTPESAGILERTRHFLEAQGVFPLGRYGRWEYSSMAQVVADGWSLAEKLLETP